MRRIPIPLTVIVCFALFTAPIAMAEPVYFVSVAKIADGKQKQYDKFLRAVAPIWKRYGLEVLLRTRTVDVVRQGDFSDAPTEIGILRVDNYDNFLAYVADTDYSDLKQSRLDAVDNFVVLEGRAINFDGVKFLTRAPMAAIVINTTNLSSPDASLELQISMAGQVKGPVSGFLKQARNVEVHALSFDDNPTEYLPKGDISALLLIGEIIRR